MKSGLKCGFGVKGSTFMVRKTLLHSVSLNTSRNSPVIFLRADETVSALQGAEDKNHFISGYSE